MLHIHSVSHIPSLEYVDLDLQIIEECGIIHADIVALYVTLYQTAHPNEPV